MKYEKNNIKYFAYNLLNNELTFQLSESYERVCIIFGHISSLLYFIASIQLFMYNCTNRKREKNIFNLIHK